MAKYKESSQTEKLTKENLNPLLNQSLGVETS